MSIIKKLFILVTVMITICNYVYAENSELNAIAQALAQELYGSQKTDAFLQLTGGEGYKTIESPLFRSLLTTKELKNDENKMAELIGQAWGNLYYYENEDDKMTETKWSGSIYEAVKNGPCLATVTAKNEEDEEVNVFFSFNIERSTFGVNYWINWNLNTQKMRIAESVIERYAEDIEFLTDFVVVGYIHASVGSNSFFPSMTDKTIYQNFPCTGTDIIKVLDHFKDIVDEKETLQNDSQITETDVSIQNPEGKCIANKVNIRENPEMNSRSIGILNKGDALKILYVDGEWSMIQTKDKTGYIKTKYIEFGEYK